MTILFSTALCLGGLAAAVTAQKDGARAWHEELAPAVKLEANGTPIVTSIGHAAPLVLDYDGDGKKDLLVGQFGSGRDASPGELRGGTLRIYLNQGTNAAPRFVDFDFLRASGNIANVPSS